jgi:hypothetical protein
VSLLSQITTVLDQAGIPHAIIGATALTVYGVNRSTLDLDLFVTSPASLGPDLWTSLPSSVEVDIRRGDLTDPLAGVVRFRAPGSQPIDLVVGKLIWQRELIERAVPAGNGPPVVRLPDLILLKLYAGGPQDAWDIQQLLERTDGAEILREVEENVPKLPAHSAKLWQKILQFLT